MASASAPSSFVNPVDPPHPSPLRSDHGDDLARRVEEARTRRELPSSAEPSSDTTWQALAHQVICKPPFECKPLTFLGERPQTQFKKPASKMPPDVQQHPLRQHLPNVGLFWLWLLKLHPEIVGSIKRYPELSETYFSSLSEFLSLLFSYQVNPGQWTTNKQEPTQEFLRPTLVNLASRGVCCQLYMDRICQKLGPHKGGACQEFAKLWQVYFQAMRDSHASLSGMPRGLTSPSVEDFLAFGTFCQSLSGLYSQWSKMLILGLPENFVRQIKTSDSEISSCLKGRFQFYIGLWHSLYESCIAVSRSKLSVPDLLSLYLQLVPCLSHDEKFDNSMVTIALRNSLGLRAPATPNTYETAAYNNLLIGLGDLPVGCVCTLHHMVWSALMVHISPKIAIAAIEEVHTMLKRVSSELAEICRVVSSERNKMETQPAPSPSDYLETSKLRLLDTLLARSHFLSQIGEKLEQGLSEVSRMESEQKKTRPFLAEIVSQTLIGLSSFLHLYDSLSETDGSASKGQQDIQDTEAQRFISIFEDEELRRLLAITEEWSQFFRLMVQGGTDRLLRMLGKECDVTLTRHFRAQRLEEARLIEELRPCTAQPPKKSGHQKKKKRGQGRDHRDQPIRKSKWDQVVAPSGHLYAEEEGVPQDHSSEVASDWQTIISKKRPTNFSCPDSASQRLELFSALTHQSDCPSIRNCAFWMKALDLVNLDDSQPPFEALSHQLDLIHRILEGLLLHSLIRAKVEIPRIHSLISLARSLPQGKEDPLSQAIHYNWDLLSFLSNLNNALHYPHSSQSDHPSCQKLAHYLRAMRIGVNLHIHSALLANCRSVIEDLCAGILGQPSPDWKMLPKDIDPRLLSLPEESSHYFDLSMPDDKPPLENDTEDTVLTGMEGSIRLVDNLVLAPRVIDGCFPWIEALRLCRVEGEQHTDLRRELRNNALDNVKAALEMSKYFLKGDLDRFRAIGLMEWVRRTAKELMVAILLHYPAYDEEGCHVLEQNRRTNSFPKLFELIQRFTPVQLTTYPPNWLCDLHEGTHFPVPLPYHARRSKQAQDLLERVMVSDPSAIKALNENHSLFLLNYLVMILRAFGKAKSIV